MTEAPISPGFAQHPSPARPKTEPMILRAGSVPFIKMHGLGNDFVVVDARAGGVRIDPVQAARIADRHTGVGFDQLVLLEPARSPHADVFVRFLNADGSESGACGNGTRCAAALLMDENGSNRMVLETLSGLLPTMRRTDGLVTVDMGPAKLGWREVPLAEAADTGHVKIGVEALDEAVCCSMGNPHATFFVEDADALDLARLGPLVEHHPMFPERVNVGVVHLIAPGKLRLRVWERGAGLTLACGSGACAALVAAARRGLVPQHNGASKAELVLERGSLVVEWRDDGHVLMTGPTARSFNGVLGADMLSAG
ncbi:MAG TPA: diaminopimelate epimerase [Stellaceae bacterium]|nr:diaminopimelate epimerase [Stellaceae bacterium]